MDKKNVQHSARDIAVRALLEGPARAASALDMAITAGELSSADAALAREITLGSIRRKATLTAVLRAFLEKPDLRLPEPIWKILSVAMYQVLFLDRVPDFAAVNEAVEQTSRMGYPRQRGLVNGVLRAILRGLEPLQRGEVVQASDVIPVGPSAMRRCSKAIFPDPERDEVGYLAAAGSMPELLAQRWLKRLGLPRAAMQAALHACTSPALVARVNTLKSSVRATLASIKAEGGEAVAHDNGHSIVLIGGGLTNLTAFKEGWIQPQDATATAVSLAAAPQGGSNVLDLCAAPGTKTGHLAELMGNRGRITAVDVSEKLSLIEQGCRRLGVDIVSTWPTDRLGELPAETFDLVLADVPCTNTGVLARRPEAKWHFTQEFLADVTRDQQFLIAAAQAFVRTGGRLVYSTCSMETEECEGLIQRFIKRHPRMRVISQKVTRPGGAENPAQWHDGGFVAILQKT
ncbi:MAG: hypothetical protein LLG01_06190 [Planctomycetaceae bacterium]|nr:hypothetical protein [Planctomycetaceae bacterium]